jgi:general nucleoside transport system ATP-binding protein
MTASPMLEMSGIVKRFPGVVANAGVDFEVRAGEVHTLLGENGAGKSTLMKILYGLYQADSGGVRLEGEEVEITSPTDAIAHGIGMIHQHFMLVDTLTVAENVALGLKSDRGALTDFDRVSERIGELSERYGLDIDPEALIWQLAVGQRQRVEIIKALYRDAKLLILDEPTAVLTPQEVDQLFVTLRQMTTDGRGLIFISHKLHEVLALSDRITVLRLGRVTGHVAAADATREVLAEMMVGRQVQMVPDKPPVAATEPVLQIKQLTVMGDRGEEAVQGLDLEVRAGEILGIAGVSGNGQRELAEAISGLRPVESGTVQIGGADVTNLRPAQVRAHGLAYVPEERMHSGAIAGFSVAENLLLIDHGDDRFVTRGMLDFDAIRQHCQALVEEYDVKTPSLDTLVQSLSGGNIQKLILARELSGTPKVLLASQPTRGVDIGASEYIHQRLIEQRSESTAILMVSEDLDEVFALSDRIAVIYEGEILGVVDAAATTRQAVGLMMAGVKSEEVA